MNKEKKKFALITLILSVTGILLLACTGLSFLIFTLLFEATPEEEVGFTHKPEIAITYPTGRDWYKSRDAIIEIGGIVGSLGENDLIIKKGGELIPTEINGHEWSAQITLNEGDNSYKISITDTEGGVLDSDLINILHVKEVLAEEFSSSEEYLQPGKTIRVQFRVKLDKKPSERIALYQVDSLDPTMESSYLGEMLDDGGERSGDETKGDLIYSIQMEMEAVELTPLHFRVATDESSTNPSFISEPLQIPIYHEPSKKSYDEMVENSIRIEEEYNNTLNNIETENLRSEAAEYMIKWLAQQEFISRSGKSEEGTGVWWEFRDSGIIGGITNNKEGTKSTGFNEVSSNMGSLIMKASAQEESDSMEVGNFKALYLGPYYSFFQPNDDWHFAFKEIKKSECPKYEIREKKDDQVVVEDFRSLDQYGMIVISTHGDTWLDGSTGSEKGLVVTHTSQILSFENYLKYYSDLKAQRLAARVRSNGLLLSVLPSYIERYNHSMPNSLVYISACRSAYNNSLAKVFLGAGAKAYYGYSDYVQSDYAYWTGGYMTRGFIHQDKNAAEAFEYGKEPRGSHDDKSPLAYFTHYGENLLIEGEDPCCSGECFSGSYSGTISIPDTNPQNLGHTIELNVSVDVEEGGIVTGSINITEPEYEVVLDPESPNPLHLDTRSGEGSGEISGSWDINSRIVDYAPAVNGIKVAEEVVESEFYTIEMKGSGSYTQRSEDGQSKVNIVLAADGALSKEKIHMTISTEDGVLGRIWIYRDK